MLNFLYNCPCFFTKKRYQHKQVAVVESSSHEEASDHFRCEKGKTPEPNYEPTLEPCLTESIRSSSMLSECSDANIEQIIKHLNTATKKVILFADDSIVCIKKARQPLVNLLCKAGTKQKSPDFAHQNWKESGLVYENINNHFIIYVGNGDIAFRVFTQIPEEHPIIVFTDNNMPIKTGLELIKSIKETEKKQPIAFGLHTSDDANSLSFRDEDIIYLEKNSRESICDFFKKHCLAKSSSIFNISR